MDGNRMGELTQSPSQSEPAIALKIKDNADFSEGEIPTVQYKYCLLAFPLLVNSVNKM